MKFKKVHEMAELSERKKKFIVHWGEMGTMWGINRTVAQIHALLFLSDKAIHAEEIGDTLMVARSNVSNSLKELQRWRLVKVVQRMGDRKDYFEAKEDVWEMFRIVMEERKRKEILPTMEMVRECLEDDKGLKGEELYAYEKMREIYGFFEVTTSWCDQIQKLPTKGLVRFLKMGSKVTKLFGGKGKRSG